MQDDIDFEIMDNIKNMMSAKFNDLIEKYLKNSTDYIKRADQAVIERDAETVLSVVHPLKSASASLGLVRMEAIAKSIEAVSDTMVNGGADKWLEIEKDMAALQEAYVSAEEILITKMEKAG